METRITVIQLLNQLKEAKRNIREWHGMNERDPVKEKAMWEIYEKNSPEMKRLNESIDFGERWLNEPEKTIDIAKQETDKQNDSATYSLGMVQGIKLTLLNLQKLINEQDPATGGKMIVEFAKLFTIVNDFPTVKENGKFIIEPNEGYPTFEWVQERRDLIAKHLKG